MRDDPVRKGYFKTMREFRSAKMKKPPSAIRIDGATAYIALTMGLEAAIDVADIPLVSNRRWRILTGKAGNYYAVSGQHPNAVLLHRLLMGTPNDVKIDHKDGDGLNNRRLNIRPATGTQNNANMMVSRKL